MASAAFSIAGGASLAKASVAATTSIALALDSTDGVDTVLWEIATTSDGDAPGDYTIVAPTATSTTVTSLAAGSAAIVRCTVNGGATFDRNGNSVVGDLVKTAKFFVATAGGDEVICTGENTESDSTHGYAPIINALIRAGGGSGDVTAAASTTANRLIAGDSTAKGIKDNTSGIDDSGSGTLSRAGSIELSGVGISSNASLTAGNDAILSHGTAGVTRFREGANDQIVMDLAEGGAHSITHDPAATSVTHTQSIASGNGANWTIKAQDGGASSTGGSIAIEAGDAGSGLSGVSGDITLTADTAQGTITLNTGANDTPSAEGVIFEDGGVEYLRIRNEYIDAAGALTLTATGYMSVTDDRGTARVNQESVFVEIDNTDSPVTGAYGRTYIADTSTGAITLNAPAGATAQVNNGFIVAVTGANDVTVDMNGTDTIDGVGTSVVTDGEVAVFALVEMGSPNRWRRVG